MPSSRTGPGPVGASHDPLLNQSGSGAGSEPGPALEPGLWLLEPCGSPQERLAGGEKDFLLTEDSISGVGSDPV